MKIFDLVHKHSVHCTILDDGKFWHSTPAQITSKRQCINPGSFV